MLKNNLGASIDALASQPDYNDRDAMHKWVESQEGDNYDPMEADTRIADEELDIANNPVLTAIGFNPSAYKSTKDVEPVWRSVFEHFDKTYPNNKKISAEESNKLWYGNGYDKAYKTLEDLFDKYAIREWNKEHPAWKFNKELQRYEKRPTENLKWNEELGEWE